MRPSNAMHQDELRADCSRCVGLCCVAPTFARSADFAIDKPAGVACPNLTADFRCSIHSELRASGFPGCAAYDCFGAGQVVTAQFGGAAFSAEMFAAFDEARDRHELLWHLHDAQRHSDDAELQAAIDRLPSRRDVNELLLRVSALVRGDGRPDLTGDDLVGKDLRGRDLRGAMLFNSLLIGADLTGVDLRGADLRSADLRGANVRGADLTGCLFLTRMQVESARGDGATRLSSWVSRPSHW